MLISVCFYLTGWYGSTDSRIQGLIYRVDNKQLGVHLMCSNMMTRTTELCGD